MADTVLVPKINKPSEEIMSNYNEFIKVTWLTEADILAKVWTQSQEWINFVSKVREELQADLILFKSQKSNEDKIWDTTLFNNHSALMARSYQDKPSALFDTMDISQKDAVVNLNAVYKEDFESEDMDILSYWNDWYTYLFWVWITARIGWDWYTKSNKFQVVDPRIWIPEPNWDYVSWDYSYTWFEKLYDQADVYNQGWMNADQLYPLTNSAYSLDLLKKRDQQNMSLINIWANRVFNPYYDIYFHFCKFQDKEGKYRWAKVIMWNNRRLLLDIKLLSAVSKEEEKNPELIKPPFAFQYWKPEPNNPFWDRPANKLRDVQRVKAILANLRLNKAKAELYPMYFYNKKYIQNKSDLTFWFNKFIAVDTWMDWAINLDAIVRPFRPDLWIDTTVAIDQLLDKQVERSTSIWEVAQWSEPEQRQTATLNNLVQSNTDLNLSINQKVKNWYVRQLIREWLRWYLENFASWDKKFVSIDTWIGTVPMMLTKREFLIWLQVKIQILSSWQIEAQKQKERLAMQQLINLAMADQSIPMFSKNLLLRDYAEAMWYPAEKLSTRFWYNVDEALAKQENWMLLLNIKVPVNANDDDLCHLTFHKWAGNWDLAQIHIAAHMQQWISKWKPQPNTWETWWMQQSMQAQMASSIAAQNNAPVPNVTTNS